ncbi:MAG: hypothetical protein HKM92_05510 [Arenibacter sp.]|nr:hypothetical protein [Arenibacter sp.]
MKKFILGMAMLATMALSFTSCSDDDDAATDCDTCTAQGQEIEICDNGNDTFTLTVGGESETIPASELQGVSPEDFIGLICTLANTTP